MDGGVLSRVGFENAELVVSLFDPLGNERSSDTSVHFIEVFDDVDVIGDWRISVELSEETQDLSTEYRAEIEVFPPIIPTAPLPECEDDGECNFSPFDAIFIGHSRGFPSRACPGVSEFFYFEADAADQIDLELLFSHDAGDLDLFVFEPVGWSIDVSTGELFTNFIPFTPVVAAEGTTQTDDEFVSFTADRSGLWFVEVRPGDIVSQEFDIELLSPCNDDRRENLSMADADLLSFASRGGGTACDGAPDYYFFDANVGDEIEVDLDFRPEGGDLDLALIAPDGVSVRAVSEPDADGEMAESLSFTADVSGTWYARVSANPDEANHNHFRLELESPLPCVDDENEPNNDAASATAAEDLGGFPGRRDSLAEGWICSGPDAVDWYTFPVVIGGGSVLVEVEGFGGAFDLEGGDLVVTLFDPLGAEQSRSERATDSSLLRMARWRAPG